MKTLALLSITLAVLCASAQHDSPSIKGHKIGESINQYLITENGGPEDAANLMTGCATLLNNPKQRRKQASRAETCSQIAGAIDGLTVILSGNRGGKFQFASAKLVEITLVTYQDFGTVEGDLVAKFGRPDSEEQVAYQNGFGATFSHPSAFWRRPDVFVTVVESPTATVGPGTLFGKKADVHVFPIAIVITDRSYSESLAAEKERQRPSPLD